MPLTQPPTGKPSPFLLGTFSEECLGDAAAAAKAGVASNVYPSSNLALFFPIKLTETRTYTGILWENGGGASTGSANINAAVYDLTGTVIAGSTIGSVGQGTLAVFQKKAFASPVILAPGKYFLAFCCDNGTATFARSSLGGAFLRAAGVRQLAGFFALTASAAAWVGATNGFLPAVYLYEPSWL